MSPKSLLLHSRTKAENEEGCIRQRIENASVLTHLPQGRQSHGLPANMAEALQLPPEQSHHFPSL